jgi:predicted NAD/FAD-dependent oxidoreductase
MGQAASLSRRALLAAAAAALAGCDDLAHVQGGFAGGAAFERGHKLRDARTWPQSRTSRRTQVLIAGAGIAGLAAARALRRRGIEDFVVLDLEDAPGGNSRGTQVEGIACPLGAHYLPVPGDAAREVQQFLEELGLRKRVAGRWVYDERHLCHSPQERLFFRGAWQDGLLPVQGVEPGTLAQYRRFAQRVEALGRQARFAIPIAFDAAARAHPELDALTLAAWLDREGLTDPLLRGYLDYCCRDDYGAGIGVVSAWAGIHYFAARHGFQAPGTGDGANDPPLTWPEGNAWLARALADPLAERWRGGRIVARIAQQRHGVELEAMNAATGEMEHWQAQHCIVALPAFVAARVVQNAPDFLLRKAQATRYAPWVVANLHLRAPLADRGGAAPAWDNVIHGSAGLGYVDARHQSLDPVPGPTVLTWYHAPGPQARADLLRRPWSEWRDTIVAELSVPHPDLARKLTRIEVARYGHAMAIPTPGALALAGAPPRWERITLAHADYSGYSIFEEAFTQGERAGSAV